MVSFALVPVVGGRVCYTVELTEPSGLTLANTQDQLLKATEQLNEANQALAGATNKVCSHLHSGGGYKVL